ncbi:MAG: STT3 domain-containing protein [Candidatus Nanoarchaeia archaeon]
MSENLPINQKTASMVESVRKFFAEKEKFIYWLGLLPIFAIALWIRIQNLPLLRGKYLIELDSYFFFRHAKMLLEQGSVPAIDYMRYVPVGLSTKGTIFFPKTLVILYKFLHIFFPNLSQIEWHIIYPPVITIISFIFFFLFVKEILNYKTAFIAVAFLAVIPAYIQRTGAGFADHEAISMLWFFISLWLFVLAWKSQKHILKISFAGLSGLFASFMAGSWGGYIFLPGSLALFGLVFVALTNKAKKIIHFFTPWLITYLIFGSIVTDQGAGFLKNWPNLLLFFMFGYAVLTLLLNKTKFSLQKYASLVSFCIALALGLVVNYFGKFIKFSDIILFLTKKGASRLFFTVAENAAPYFTDWWRSFGIILLLAFAGSTLYFYYLFNSFDSKNKKYALLASSAYILFISTFLFGRFSSFGGIVVEFFSKTYMLWLITFVVMLASVWLFATLKEKDLSFESKWPWLLLGILLISTLLAARDQIRLTFITVPAMAIAAGFFVSNTFEWAKKQRAEIKIVTIIILVLVSLFGFVTAAQSSAIINKHSGSMTPGQWEAAMKFLREQTPKDSVVAHWWDYGYLTITVGERAAVTDGGNSMGWNHQSGRYFLTGKDENSTLTYLKTHNVTHILISDEEILKYHAFSFIGSDENLDRESTMGIFVLTQQKEVRNGTALIYEGGWPFDKDYVINKLVLPKNRAGIGGFSLTLQNETIINPIAYVVYNKEIRTIPISCIYIKGNKIEFQTENQSLKGCLVLIPSIDQSGRAIEIGGALWLSEKVWDTNFARLYIYNESSPYFELVYQDDLPLAIYQGSIIGPIKIWQVRYPEWVKPDPFYLQSSTYG